MSVELMQEVTTALGKFRDDVTGELKKVQDASGQRADEAKAALEGRLGEIEKGLKAVQDNQKTTIGLPGCEKEAKKFSVAKFFNAMYRTARHEYGSYETAFAKLAPLEGELSAEYMKRRAYTADDGSAGGFLIPPEVYNGKMIEPAFAQTPILNLPVLKMTGLKGDMPVPVSNGHTTAYHIGENDKPTVSQSSWGLKWLRPKKIGVFTKISNRLLAESNENIEALITNYMSRDASVELSRGLTVGSGGAGEPKGLAGYTGDMTAGLSCAGRRLRIDDAMALKQKLAVANELRDTNTYAYLMRPEALYGMIRERVIPYSGASRANGFPVASPSLFANESMLGSGLGAQLKHTTQIPNNESYSTSTTCSKAFFGDWSLFAFATFRDPVFKVSDVAGDGSTGSAFLQDQLYIVTFIEYDCSLLRPAAFTYAYDVETTEANWSV